MNEAFITPEVARWARERSGSSPDQLAAHLHVRPEQIAAWESGEVSPPFGKAQDLARALHIPFGYLFLSQPPLEKTPLPDLRTVDGHAPAKPSPDFIDLLNDVLLKQQWYREYAEDSGAEPLGFVGRFTSGDGMSQVATDLVNLMGIEEARKRSHSWDDYLRSLVQNAEALGVLVMRSGIVGGNTRRTLSVSEFRGFVVSDRLAPLVFINGRDAKAAQIFTLVHELAHIWIGTSGISNTDSKEVPREQKNSTEQFCNAVAAEVLVPEAEFIAACRGIHVTLESLQKMATTYRVSLMVVLRRAYELGKLGRTQFFELVEQEQKRQQERASTRPDKSGGDFYATLPARNSRRLTETILDALQGGKVLHWEAAKLLGVKVATLPKLLEGRARS